MNFGLDIIVNVQTSSPPRGVGFANPNTILLLTNEQPLEEMKDGYGTYRNSGPVATDFGSDSKTFSHAVNIFGQDPNPLYGKGMLYIAPMLAGETIKGAILRLQDIVYFCGILPMTIATADDEEILEASAVVQAKQNSILLVSDNRPESLDDDGLFKKISQRNLYRTKMIYYGMGDKELATMVSSAYAGRAFTVDFNASNSCTTMQLKDLTNVDPDTSVTENMRLKMENLGVDGVLSVAGLGKVQSNKSSKFFDQVYNSIWFTMALQVVYFNALATTRTKIAQTETGMEYIKGRLRSICKVAIANGMLAPNTWNSSDTFGNPEDFKRNISDNGYFIYSLPIREQLQEDREKRIAPTIQLAGKEAGAIHSGSVMVNFEA